MLAWRDQRNSSYRMRANGHQATERPRCCLPLGTALDCQREIAVDAHTHVDAGLLPNAAAPPADRQAARWIELLRRDVEFERGRYLSPHAADRWVSICGLCNRNRVVDALPELRPQTPSA